MRNRLPAIFVLVSLALAAVPACKPADAATLLKSSPPGRSGSSWYDTESAAHVAAVPLLTESIAVTPVDMPLLGAVVLDAAKEGGAIKANTAGFTVSLSHTLVYQAMNASKIGVSWQASLGAPESGKTSYLVIINTNGHSIRIGTDFSVSTTNVIAFVFDGAAIAPAAPAGPDAHGGIDMGAWDTSVHTFRVTSNGTTATFYRDGVAKGTLATSVTHFPSDAAYIAIQDNVTSSGQALYKVLYSILGPS